MNESLFWYYYLHSNGDLIGKNPIVINSDSRYFDSPFVQTIWRVDLTDRGSMWKMILESLAKGARIDRVKELAEKWKCDLKDLIEMLKHVKNPSYLMKGGMDIFVEKILEMDIDSFWELIKDMKIFE